MDMHAEGMIEDINPDTLYVRLSGFGIRMATKIREHKINGGSFSDFQPKTPIDRTSSAQNTKNRLTT